MKPNRLGIKASFAKTFSRLFLPFTVFIWGACWVVAVLAGPFGSFAAMSLSDRIIYWGIICTCGVVIGFAVYAITLSALGTEKHRAFAPLATALLTLMFAPFVMALHSFWAFGPLGLDMTTMSTITNTFVISASIFLFRQLSFVKPDHASNDGAQTTADMAVQDDTSVGPVPRLMRRLPDHAKGLILRITAKNHHVEVATENGQVELRMRFTDAIGEMDPIAGICVHRSHWVTLSAITKVERINAHKICVHLSNGDEIPASRKYRVNLVEAGLMPAEETA